jgi:hypothetical protein
MRFFIAMPHMRGGEPLVCGTYGQEAYTEDAVAFGSLLLFLQAVVVFWKRAKPELDKFEAEQKNKNQAEHSARA